MRRARDIGILPRYGPGGARGARPWPLRRPSRVPGSTERSGSLSSSPAATLSREPWSSRRTSHPPGAVTGVGDDGEGSVVHGEDGGRRVDVAEVADPLLAAVRAGGADLDKRCLTPHPPRPPRTGVSEKLRTTTQTRHGISVVHAEAAFIGHWCEVGPLPRASRWVAEPRKAMALRPACRRRAGWAAIADAPPTPVFLVANYGTHGPFESSAGLGQMVRRTARDAKYIS